MIKVDRLKGTTEGLIKLRWLGLALIFCALGGAAYARPPQKPEFRFAAIISDNMVLQQQKKARIETILDELQKDKWLSRNLEKYPALVEKIESARNAIEETKAEAAKTKSP